MYYVLNDTESIKQQIHGLGLRKNCISLRQALLVTKILKNEFFAEGLVS